MNIVEFDALVYSINLARLAHFNYVQTICSPRILTHRWRYLHTTDTAEECLEYLYKWHLLHELRYPAVLAAPFAIIRLEFVNAKDTKKYRFAERVDISTVYCRETSPDLLHNLPLFRNCVDRRTIIGEIWYLDDKDNS